jgi:hypothetical protein
VPYFEINSMGDDLNRELAFIEHEPEELGGFGYRLAEGDPAAAIYPDDAHVYLDPYSPGLMLPTLLGNSIGYLIVNSALKTIVHQHDVAPTEMHPLAIYDQRRRLHSRDYWILNPLRFVDCLNRQASKIQYLSSDPSQIVGIDELVFDPKRLEKAPDLFRIREQPTGYFASERLVGAMQGKGFNNVFLNEIKEQG